jgi:hypothetical protein
MFSLSVRMGGRIQPDTASFKCPFSKQDLDLAATQSEMGSKTNLKWGMGLWGREEVVVWNNVHASTKG